MRKVNFNDKGNLLTVVCVSVLITVLLTTVSVLALVPSETFVVSSGAYPGAPTYTFWTDGGGNYFSKNQYGTIAYSGTDADLVMNQTITAVSSGATILFGVGAYTFDNPIIINDKSITLMGTMGDVNKGGTILRFDTGVNGFVINSDATDYTPNVIIQGFLLTNVSGYAGTGVLSKGQYLTVRDVAIEGFAVGISLEMGTGVSAGDSLINNVVVRNCQYQGILIQSNDNRMSNVIVHGNEDGIQLSTSNSGGLQASNIHTWGNSANGLKITQSVYDYFVNFVSEGNQGWGVYIGSLTGNVTSTKFSNSWVWCNTNAYPTYSGLMYVGDATHYINQLGMMGGQLGDSGEGGDFTKGSNALNSTIRFVDLTFATINAWTQGTLTDDIYP